MCPSASSAQPSGAKVTAPSIVVGVAGLGRGLDLRPDAAVGQRAVGLDRERREAGGEGLGDDERAVVGDDHAVGEPEVLGGDARAAVGVDAHERRGRRVAAAHEVEAEVAGVGAPLAVDDHVVEVPARERRDVGVLGDRAVGRAPQHAPVLHGHDQQVAVGQPPEARGLALDLEHGLLAAVGVVGEDRAAVEVRGPPAAVVPARALEVGAALEQRRQGSFVMLSLLRPRRRTSRCP